MTGWRVLCGWLVFVAVSTTVAAGLATLAGKVDVPGAWISLALGCAAGVFAARGSSAPRQRITAGRELGSLPHPAPKVTLLYNNPCRAVSNSRGIIPVYL